MSFIKALFCGLLLSFCAQAGARAAVQNIYFSDNQTGATPGAVAGSNSNPGTPEAPKRNLDGININTLPAGTRLLFARGGAWAHGNLRIANLNARADAPIVFDAYGSGPPPLITTTSGHASFEFGINFFDTTTHEGYVFRNLALRGPGGGPGQTWAFWLKGNVSHVTVENVDISGYYIAINCQSGGLNRFVTVRNNHIHDNRGMGILGHMNDSLIERNLFTTPAAHGFVHQIYLSNGSRNTVRGNRLIYDRLCTGGHITAHGLIDGLTIEDNFIQCPDATEGSWGISLEPYGVDAAQGFTNLIVRRNYLENVGNTAIVIRAAPGVVVEDNITRLTIDRYQTSVAIGNPERPAHLEGPATVRNNTHYGLGGGFVVHPVGGTVEGNTRRSGSPAAPLAPADLTAAVADGQVRLAWPPVADASGYTVKRAFGRGGPYATIASGLTVPTFTDSGLVNGTTCHYVVSATNAFAGGPESAPISVAPRIVRTASP